MPVLICITFQPAAHCVCYLNYCHYFFEQHQDTYVLIYCLVEINKQHNIHQITLFQKDPNDSHELGIQPNWSRLPSLLGSFLITEYTWHILSLFSCQISELIAVQPNPWKMSCVLSEFFMNPTLNLQALRCTKGTDIFTLPDQHHCYLS